MGLLVSHEFRFSARIQALENLRAQVELRRILILAQGQWLREIGAVQFLFDLLNFVLLHEEKIAVEFVG